MKMPGTDLAMVLTPDSETGAILLTLFLHLLNENARHWFGNGADPWFRDSGNIANVISSLAWMIMPGTDLAMVLTPDSETVAILIRISSLAWMKIPGTDLAMVLTPDSETVAILLTLYLHLPEWKCQALIWQWCWPQNQRVAILLIFSSLAWMKMPGTDLAMVLTPESEKVAI